MKITKLGLFLSVLVVVAATRWPLAPKYLYYFDSVNFALALEDFDPIRHQPQPPGYPLFVGLTRIVHWFVAAPERVFVITGILASVAAVLLIWLLGDRLGGAPAGLMAAALLIFNPPFWLAALTNQVRLFLAVGGISVALLAWRGRELKSPAGWFYGTAAALGAAGGFRPTIMVLLVPLLAWSGIRARRTLRQWLVAAGLLALTCAAWLAVTIAACGGIGKYLDLLSSYADFQFSGSSSLFGGSWAAAWEMFYRAALFNGLGALSWIWALLFAWRQRPPAPGRAALLALWFLPGFLFSAVVHIGDPDQALLTVPVLCLIGALVMARSAGTPGGVAALATAGALLNAVLFVFPPGKLARDSSVHIVRAVDRQVRDAFESVREVGHRPVVLVHSGSVVTWRQFMYYFPDLPLLLLHGEPDQKPSTAPWLLQHRSNLGVKTSGDALVLPANHALVWLLMPNPRWLPALQKSVPTHPEGAVLVSEPTPGARFRFGVYEFLCQ